MKIALVHMRHRRVGGTERFLNALAQHLAECGHEATVLCRTHEGAPHPRVSFRRLPGFSVGASWRMWSFARAVEAHVQENAYDIVFGLGKTWTHDVIRLGGGCHASYLERVETRARLKDRLALSIEARALAPGAYRCVIANSSMVKRDVVRRHAVPADAVEVIHNGVDLERFNPSLRGRSGLALRRELGLSETQRVVLFLGTGFHRKGLDRALAALEKLHANDRETRLLVVGHDSQEGRWHERARRSGLGDAVHFLGRRSDPEHCYAAADVYLLPTRYDPFANSSLEALACGIPLVTTPDNGAAELLGRGDAGSVVDDADSPEALADALAHWLAIRPGTTAARALAEANGADAMTGRILSLLERLAATR